MRQTFLSVFLGSTRIRQKPPSHIRHLGLVLFCLFHEAALANTSQHHLDLTLGGSYFDYREYSSSKRELNRESGALPGLGAEWESKTSHWQLNAAVMFQKNQVKYDGELQNGLSYQTDTDESLRHISLNIRPNTTSPIVPMVGLGHWYWERQILPGSITTTNSTQQIIGLLEIYQWPYVEIGAELHLNRLFSALPDHRKHVVALSWANPSKAEMEVFLPNKRITVEPLSKPGYYLAYGIHMEAIKLSLYQRRWRLERSPVVRGIFEPDNQTTVTGLILQLRLF
jgi:hypothetical protein